MLKGNYLVKITRGALSSGKSLINGAKDNFLLRDQLLELASLHNNQSIDYDWIKCCPPGEKIGELRIKLQINKIRNLRAIFWIDECKDRCVNGMKVIWILEVFAKKNMQMVHTEVAKYRRIKDTLKKSLEGV